MDWLGDVTSAIGDAAKGTWEFTTEQVTNLVDVTTEQVTNLVDMTEEIMSGTINQDIDIDIENGKGSINESKYTAGKTVTGYFIIQSPSQGTWDIVAKVDGKTVMNRGGVSQGEEIPFKVETSCLGPTNLKLRVTWSKRADTTLTAHLYASY